MNEILIGIWQNAPGWVWPLFFVLLLIGYMATRTRNSSIIPYLFYPLFGLAAANSIAGLSHVPLSWIVFSGSYLIGAAVAFRWQNGLILEKEGAKLRLQGDRITILILMLIFCSNFVNGVVAAVGPHLLEALVYTVVFASIIGMCSGSFTGRALRVLTLSNRTRPNRAGSAKGSSS